MALSYFTGGQHSAHKAIMAYTNDAVFREGNLRTAADSNSQIKLKGKNTMWAKVKGVIYGF